LVVIWGPLGMRDGYQQAIRNQSFWWLEVFLSIFMFMVSLGSLNCTR
jgi:membrane-associated protease RseP (regulator of RpoE activity)